MGNNSIAPNSRFSGWLFQMTGCAQHLICRCGLHEQVIGTGPDLRQVRFLC